MLWYTSKLLPYPSSRWKHQGIFLRYLLWKVGWVPGVSGGKSLILWDLLLWLGIPRVFNFQACPHWVSIYLSIIVQVFLCGHWFLQWLQLWVSAPVSHDSLNSLLCCSNLESSSLPCVLLKRVVEFSVCSALYLLLGQSNDF